MEACKAVHRVKRMPAALARLAGSTTILRGDRLVRTLALPVDGHHPPAMAVEHRLETVDAAPERFGIGCGMTRQGPCKYRRTGHQQHISAVLLAAWHPRRPLRDRLRRPSHDVLRLPRGILHVVMCTRFLLSFRNDARGKVHATSMPFLCSGKIPLTSLGCLR